MARPLLRGDVWRLDDERRIVIYSGNMFNELTDVGYVITMEVRDRPDAFDVELPGGGRVCYTSIDHTIKSALVELVGQVPEELMSKVNTRLFMVISTN